MSGSANSQLDEPFSPCTSTPETACLDTDIQDMKNKTVVACFNGLYVSSDNGLIWETIFDASKIGGININLNDLGNSPDLTNIEGVITGSLKTNTCYSCAKAVLNSIIIISENGSSCSATSFLKNNNGLDIANLYIRGTDQCPGDLNYPTFIPFETTNLKTIDLKFDTKFQNTAPLMTFTIKPATNEQSSEENLTKDDLISDKI